MKLGFGWKKNRSKDRPPQRRKKADLKVGTMRKGRGIEERFLDCAGRRVRRSERGRKDVGLLRSE